MYTFIVVLKITTVHRNTRAPKSGSAMGKKWENNTQIKQHDPRNNYYGPVLFVIQTSLCSGACRTAAVARKVRSPLLRPGQRGGSAKLNPGA